MKIVFTLLAICFSALVGFSQNSLVFDKAELAFKNGAYKNALELYYSISDSKHTYKKYYMHYKKAYCFYYLNKYNQAKEEIKEALKIKKDIVAYEWIKGSSYWLYGRTYSRLNKKRKALKYFYKANKFMNNSLLYSTIAFKEIQLGKYKRALKNLNQAIDMDLDNAYAYSNRALVYVKLEDYGNARKDVDKAIILDDKNSYAYKHSALIYIAKKEYGNACPDLYKAKELGYAQKKEADSGEVDDLINLYCN